MHDVDWTGYSLSQHRRKAEKPKYPNAARQVRKNAKALELKRQEAKEKPRRAKVVKMRRAK
jgi:hypothetical protein